MPSPVEILQLEPHDDVVTVRDRLAFVRSRRVLLVWPKNGQILRRKLDLVLIQRAVSRQTARLALVTTDPQVIDHARDLNISTFASVRESQRGRWKRGRSRIFVDRSDQPTGDAHASSPVRQASRQRARLSGFWPVVRQILVVAVLLLVCAGLLGAAYIFLPSATITLTPASEQIEVSLSITADPAVTAIDLEHRVIPATPLRVEIDESASVDTTGSQEGDLIPARGTVVFTNRSTQAATIPTGTTVNTSAGTLARFRTLEAVNIPGQVDAIAIVAVEALPDYSGPVGNVPAESINFIDGPLNEILTVQNPEPIEGGALQVSQIVAQQDHDRLLAMARQAIQQRAFSELSPLLGQGQSLVLESIHIAEERPEWTVFSAPVGAPSDTVSLTMHAAVEAVVIDDRLANQAAFAGLTERIPAGQFIVPESASFTRESIALLDMSGRVMLQIAARGSVTSAVDVAAMRQALAGRTPAEAVDYLRSAVMLQPGTEPRVSLWPVQADRLPLISDRIDVILRGAS